MQEFQLEYDRCRRENQALRDALIRGRQELEQWKRKYAKGTEADWQRASWRQEPVSGSKTRNAYLILKGTQWRQDFPAAALGREDILLTDDASLCGSLMAGLPICAVEELKQFQEKPLIRVLGCDIERARQRLQAIGLREGLDYRLVIAPVQLSCTGGVSPLKKDRKVLRKRFKSRYATMSRETTETWQRTGSSSCDAAISSPISIY